MKRRSARVFATLALLAASAVLPGFLPAPSAAQESGDAYTATAIASEAVPGAITGRMVFRIASYTSEEEKKNLKEAFQKGEQVGLALLGTMAKGYINIEGQSGRKIQAAFWRDRQDGRELILVGEHMASKLENWRGVKAASHPLAVVHLRFASDGTPTSGEIFPAVKISVTTDGFLDVQTDNSNHIMLLDIARR